MTKQRVSVFFGSRLRVGSILSAVDTVLHAKGLPPAAIMSSLNGKLCRPLGASMNPSRPFIRLAVFTTLSSRCVLRVSPERKSRIC